MIPINALLGYQYGVFTLVRVETQLRISAFPASSSRRVLRTSLSGRSMLRWALAFFVIALVAAVFGFLGIAAAAISIARALFFVFLVLFLVSLVGGLVRSA